MRFVVIIISLIIAPLGCALASAVPLTAKEIGLMLRSGYSSEAVLRELSVRHFGDSFDSEVEKQIVRAGATSALIDALRSGAYQLTASEMAAAKAKLAVREENTAQALEHLKEPERTNEIGSPSERSKASTVAEPTDIYWHVKDDLVHLHQGSVTHFDDEPLETKKLYLLFFSANWSAPGRKFTAKLVEYYNRVAPQHPEFEVIFCSLDRSQFGMETYMVESNMPWPAVAYDKRAGKAGAIQNNLVREIPSLVLTDATGKILSYNHGGDNAVAPEKVLADLDEIFARGGVSAAAQMP
jgi:hypothetical protein